MKVWVGVSLATEVGGWEVCGSSGIHFYNADNEAIDGLTVFHYDYISVVFFMKIRASGEDGTVWRDGLELCPPVLRETGRGV